MDFVQLWLILFVGQLNLMAVDNLFWIFKYPIPKPINDFIRKVTGKDAYTGTITFRHFMELPTAEKIRFVLLERYVQVLINPIDIAACLTGSFVFAVIMSQVVL